MQLILEAQKEALLLFIDISVAMVTQTPPTSTASSTISKTTTRLEPSNYTAIHNF